MRIIIFISILFVASNSLANQTPEEIEMASGAGIAYAGGGVSAASGLHSIKLNPAFIAKQKSYMGSASYHWPSFGREYYQVGFIDAKTSQLTAAVQYTGFLDNPSSSLNTDIEAGIDTPTKHRTNFALGHTVSRKFLLGISGNYAKEDKSALLAKSKKSSISFGAGFVAMLNKNVNFVGSAENLFNKQSAAQPTRTFRLGTSYSYSQSMIFGLEYKNRKRSDYEILTEHSTEHMGIAIAQLSLRKYLTLIGSYAKEFKSKDTNRSVIAGGVAFKTKGLNVGYMISSPKNSSDKTHHALNIQVGIKL